MAAFYRIKSSLPNHLVFEQYTDLASQSLGSSIVAFSDEFFAEATNLLKPSAAIFIPDKYTDRGKWMDGWETRRHNPQDHDWVIIQLAYPGTVVGFDIDTTHFKGNHSPAASVEACALDDVSALETAKWTTILPQVPLKPHKSQLFCLDRPTASAYNFIRLKMFPDGGIARFRVYGTITPLLLRDVQPNPEETIDLAFVGNGGQVVACSDDFFGKRGNLILPGRGVNMGDGWETKRSRKKNHSDWIIVKLGAAGYLESIECDTRHFMGNFPVAVELHACECHDDKKLKKANWTPIVKQMPLSADKQHLFPVEEAARQQPFTHVRMTIIPDGGVKRLRVYGKPVLPETPVEPPKSHKVLKTLSKLHKSEKLHLVRDDQHQ
jgi:allantoicase